jgi:hypothetical protein
MRVRFFSVADSACLRWRNRVSLRRAIPAEPVGFFMAGWTLDSFGDLPPSA